MSNAAAEEELKGTVSSDKNEILWGRFGINYNDCPEMERKGSVIYRDYGWRGAGSEKDEVEVPGRTVDEVDGDEDEGRKEKEVSKTQKEKMRKTKMKAQIVVDHVDIIKDEFWEMRPWILGGKAVR